MPEYFGALQLPVPEPTAGAKGVGDPFLVTLLDYLTSVINAECQAAWRIICPPRRTGEEGLPVVFADPHNPDNASFSTNRVPALFAWRGDTQGERTFVTQGWESVETPVHLLWIPPPATQDKERRREAFRHAIEGAIRKGLRTGRHPAWRVAGDTYYGAETRGSVFLRHARAMRVVPGAFKAHLLWIEDEDGNKGTPFKALLATLNVREAYRRGTDQYRPLAHIEGTIELGTPNLVVNAFAFKPTLLAVTPSSGPAAGGTAIELVGHQFFGTAEAGLRVTVGGADCTDVACLDESTITATTPAGAAGAHPIVVIRPDGASATLAAAFTYV